MKHRTVTVFIVVLAALASVPKSLEQFASLREAAGNRLNAGIWNAFLSLHGQKIGGARRSQELQQATGFLPATQPIESRQVARRDKVSVEPSKPGHRLSSRQAYEIEVAVPAFEENEFELAKLDQLQHLINVDADPKGRIVIRVPETPDTKSVESLLSAGAVTFEAQAIAREYAQATDRFRQLEQHKARQVAPKPAAAVGASGKAMKIESRLLRENVFKFENSQNTGVTEVKTGSQECESTNE